MPIAVRCQCGQAYRVKEELAGRKVKCRKCGQTIRVLLPLPQSLSHDPLGTGNVPTPALPVQAELIPVVISQPMPSIKLQATKRDCFLATAIGLAVTRFAAYCGIAAALMLYCAVLFGYYLAATDTIPRPSTLTNTQRHFKLVGVALSAGGMGMTQATAILFITGWFICMPGEEVARGSLVPAIVCLVLALLAFLSTLVILLFQAGLNRLSLGARRSDEEMRLLLLIMPVVIVSLLAGSLLSFALFLERLAKQAADSVLRRQCRIYLGGLGLVYVWSLATIFLPDSSSESLVRQSLPAFLLLAVGVTFVVLHGMVGRARSHCLTIADAPAINEAVS